MSARLAIVLAFATATSARADGNSELEQARALVEHGRAAYTHSDYDGAIRAFAHAFALVPAPPLLFNLAQAHRLRGDCAHAEAFYERYLAEAPDGEARTLAETHRQTVARCASARVAIPAESTTLRRILEMPLPLPRSLRASEPMARPLGSRFRNPGLAAIAGGAAALGVAGVYAMRARDRADDVERAFATGGIQPDIAALDAEGRRAATRAWAFGVTGGVAVATGVVLIVVGRRAVPLAIAPATTGMEVVYTWRY